MAEIGSAPATPATLAKGIFVGTLRVVLSASLITLFLLLMISVSSRYEIERAFADSDGGVSIDQLLSAFEPPPARAPAAAQAAPESGGAAAEAPAAAASGADPISAFEAALNLRGRRGALLALDAQATALEAQLETLRQSLARRVRDARCPNISAIDLRDQAAETITCLQNSPLNAAGQARAALSREVSEYDKTVEDLENIESSIAGARRDVLAAERNRGAELEPALGALSDFRQALPENKGPFTGAIRSTLLLGFSLPLLITSLLLALISGMLGAVLIQLVLITLPSYEMELGTGDDFFVRVFMGGFISVVVLVAIQAGVTVTGVTDMIDARQDTIGDPTKLAFVGIVSGAFSEQIAEAAMNFAKRLGGSQGGGGAGQEVG